MIKIKNYCQIPIVFATDDNYALFLSVAIQSLKNHKKNNVQLKIYILYDQLKEETINLLMNLNDSSCQIEFINITEYFKDKNIYAVSYFSVATYYRLVAPLILNQYEKLFYLDCDIIVKGCLSDVFSMDLKNNILAGVKDYFVGDEKYINAGVLLINVKEYIKEDVFNKCMSYINENKLSFPDQDAINYTCKDKIINLPFKYNFMTYLVTDNYLMRMQNLSSIKEIVIIHYTFTYKPWNYKNFPFANLWWKETKKLPKVLKKELNNKYLSKIDKRKFNYNFYKYYFGSKLYKLWVKTTIKIKGIFQKKR